MREPTAEDIARALTIARRLLLQNPEWDVLRALAEATTTAQCNGVEGFKVFRDVRAAVEGVLPKGQTLLTVSVTGPRAAELVESARLVVAS